MGEGRQKGGRCRCGGAPTCNVTPLSTVVLASTVIRTANDPSDLSDSFKDLSSFIICMPVFRGAPPPEQKQLRNIMSKYYL